jgi:hypothetical protein
LQKLVHTAFSILKKCRLLVFAVCAVGGYWLIDAIKWSYVVSLANQGSIVVAIVGDSSEPNHLGIYDKFQLNGSQKDACLSKLREDTRIGGQSLVHAELPFLQVFLFDPKAKYVGHIAVFGSGKDDGEIEKLVRNGIRVSEYPPYSPATYMISRRMRR